MFPSADLRNALRHPRTHTSALFSNVLVQLRVQLVTGNFQTDNCVLTCIRSSMLNAFAVRQRENIVNYAHRNTGSEITRVCSRARTWATQDKRAFLTLRHLTCAPIHSLTHTHARNKRAYVNACVFATQFLLESFCLFDTLSTPVNSCA